MKAAIADTRYKIHCLRIVPLWGPTIYLTDHVRDVVMGGHTYKTDSGYEFTGVAAESGMSPGMVDLAGIAGLAGLDYDSIVSGVFDNARVYAFATTWRTPVEDEEPLGLCFMGKTTIKDDRYVAQLMMAIDTLNQSTGKSYSASCQKAFGGTEYAGCGVALGPITVTGTITSVTSGTIFMDSARTEPADWFGAGTIAFTSGANAGLKPLEIKNYAADGTIETFEPFHYAVSVGDAYTMIPGCRKRQADCRDKWSNIVNFGGFSFIPTQSTYGQIGGSA